MTSFVSCLNESNNRSIQQCFSLTDCIYAVGSSEERDATSDSILSKIPP